MSFPPDKIRRIHNHDDGWEGDWGELWELILKRLQERGPQVVWRARPELLHKEPQIVDHCVNWFMVLYSDRAYRRTLLKAWCATDHGDTNVVAWLTTWNFLHERFLDFLRQEGYIKGSRGEPDRVQMRYSGTEGSPGRVVSDECLSRWEARVAEAIQNTELPIPEEGREIPREVQTAGLELYPRLDWSKPPHEQLLRHLQGVLPERDNEGLGKLDALEACHERAFQAIRGRYERIEERLYDIYEKGRRVFWRTERDLRRRQDRLRVQLVFWPLAAKDLQELLSISKGDAHQRLSRYRRSLGRLVPELARLYELGPGEDLGEGE